MNALTPEQLHTPVLVAQCWELLREPIENAKAPVLVDATLGMGGHSEYFLRHNPKVRVIGIDRDEQARRRAAQRLAVFGQRVVIAGATYDQIPALLRRLGLEKVHGIMADLGVSSLQLDDATRGFSYSHQTDLDMRMDQSSTLSAKELLAKLPEDELAGILHTWGEERFARRIAHLIVQCRQESPISTSKQLVDIIRQAIPAPARRNGGNPAKRTFQALRIAVNNELDILGRFLPRALESLEVGGQLVVESYQSLEDRLVKQAFRAGAEAASAPGIPISAAAQLSFARPDSEVSPVADRAWLQYLTRGAIQADEDEIAKNPRAASVRLRAVKKIAPTPAGYSAMNGTSGSGYWHQAAFPTLEKMIKNSKENGGNRE